MTEPDPSGNKQSDISSNEQDQIARVMVWLAWIVAILLLVWMFQGILDKQWNPNQNPESRYGSEGATEVMLKQNKYGHYVTHGYINNEPVVFLLDTGATEVSIPIAIANRLGLTQSINSLPKAHVNTANGTIVVYSIRLSSLTIGNIELHDIAAHINPSMLRDEILLGMSVLKRVEFTQTGKILTLRQR